MPQKVVQYRLLLSCPGDIKDEINIIEESVDQFNKFYSDTLGIEIATKYWKKDSYAQSGGNPQALLNKQLVNDCDAAVAILWTRFGTPTDEYGSGTEEEIEIMLSSDKQVFMYFSDVPLPPSQQDSDEYKRVLDFKEKYSDRGIYFSYSSTEEFKKLFFAHLSQYFLSEKRISEIKEERQSVLKLVGIDAHKRIDDVAHLIDFVPNVDMMKEQYIDKLTVLFREVSEINLEKRIELKNNNSKFEALVYKPLEITEGERKIVKCVAKKIGILINESFFNLGNLSQSTIFKGINRSLELLGTKQEKEKYQKFEELLDTIYKWSEWMPIETAFAGKKCVLLALQNSGTAIDEDIEISLKIPSECLITLDNFPELNNEEKGYMLNKCDIEKMFGINSTPYYSNYSVSIVNERSFPRFRSSSVILNGTPDYSDDYTNELKSVFCYDVFEDGNCFIIKLKFDYVKHNTTVAFPSVIFIKEAFGSIDYSITSKNVPNIIRGSLELK